MRFSKRSLEGELVIDNRASGGKMVEAPTVTCSHCQRVVILNPLRTRDRRWCSSCDKYVCDFCPPFVCEPVNKVLDALQEKAFKNG